MQQEELVSIGIEVAGVEHLRKINKKHCLKQIIADIHREYEMPGEPDQYGLQYTHTKNNRPTNKYVTEENRDNNIFDACVLKLVQSPHILLKTIFEDIKDTSKLSAAMKKLNEHYLDETTTDLIVRLGYYAELCRIIVEENLQEEYLNVCLKVILMIIKRERLEKIPKEVISKIIAIILQTQFCASVLSTATALLQQILSLKPSEHFTYITEQITIDNLVRLLWEKEYPHLQCNTLSLINTFVKVTMDSGQKLNFIKEMNSVPIKNIIFNSVIRNDKMVPETKRELYVYQTYILSLESSKLKNIINISNFENNLVKQLFDENNSKKPNRAASMDMIWKFNKNLPQSSKSTTDRDFPEIPNEMTRFETQFFDESYSNCANDPSEVELRYPFINSETANLGGTSLRKKTAKLHHSDNTILSSQSVEINQLTLECLVYFKSHFPQSFYTCKLEGGRYLPGFFPMCDRICHMMCGHLHLGRKPKRDCDLFFPLIFFTDENNTPFLPELFCRLIWLLVRTRAEMKIRTTEDQEKVLKVLNKQISIILEEKPTSYSDLTRCMKMNPYSKIHEIWMNEKKSLWNKMLNNMECVQVLRLKREPDVVNLIKENRIGILRKGQLFYKFEKKLKINRVYMNLSHDNRKLIVKSFESLTGPQIILLSNVQHLITGKACSHVKDHKARNVKGAFSFLMNDKVSIDFEAEDDKIFDLWMDGLHLLLPGKKMESATYKQEKKQLLDMDLTLMLLDLENIALPSEAPVIPPPPVSYDFAT